MTKESIDDRVKKCIASINSSIWFWGPSDLVPSENWGLFCRG